MLNHFSYFPQKTELSISCKLFSNNLCLHEEIDRKYTVIWNLKTRKLLDCVLIGVCVVIRLNTVGVQSFLRHVKAYFMKCQSLFSKNRRQFAWNVTTYFLGKIRKILQNVCWNFCHGLHWGNFGNWRLPKVGPDFQKWMLGGPDLYFRHILWSWLPEVDARKSWSLF